MLRARDFKEDMLSIQPMCLFCVQEEHLPGMPSPLFSINKVFIYKFIIVFIMLIISVSNRNIVNHINILVSKQSSVDQVDVL